METVFTLDRHCSSLAGLFQHIINDFKATCPLWEDFLSKASKFHQVLRSTLTALSLFLDAFQRIADAATSARGGTREVGATLTRLCLRHRAIEAKVGALASALMDSLVAPLQERMDEWRRSNNSLDKEHTRDYKRTRGEIKKRMENTLRVQKKAKKLPKESELNKVLSSSVRDLTSRLNFLEESEKSTLRDVLKEERSRFCCFASSLRPVLEEEIGLVSELGHLQEVMIQLQKHTADPNTLPPSSEQVKDGEFTWTWHTPPSSPSSIGSRKSSVCSVSSLNSSSSSSTHSPSHGPRNRSVSQGSSTCLRSSHDSGFTSQEALHFRMSGLPFAAKTTSVLSEKSCSSDGSNGSTQGPLPSSTVCTWPNLTDPKLQVASCGISSNISLDERPHTISSAYERGKDRPFLTAYTFQPPELISKKEIIHQSSSQPVSPICMLEDEPSSDAYTATISRRGSRTSLQHNLFPSQEVNFKGKSKPPLPGRCSSLERSIAAGESSLLKQNLISQHMSSNSTTSLVPDFNMAAPDMIVPQPVYSNMAEMNLSNSATSMISLEKRSGLLSSAAYGSQPSVSVQGSFKRPKPPPPVRRSSTVSSSSLRGATISQSVSSSALNGPFLSDEPSSYTDSESSTPVGSLENFPPPPSFLLEDTLLEEGNTEDAKSFDQVDKVLLQRTVSVSETVRTLQMSNHQPPSPLTHRRSQSVRNQKKKEEIKLILKQREKSLECQQLRQQSPMRYPSYIPQSSPVPLKPLIVAPKKVYASSESFLQNLSNVLSHRQSNSSHSENPAAEKASRVRQWIANKKNVNVDPTVLHESLMDQIRKGKTLRRSRDCTVPARI